MTLAATIQVPVASIVRERVSAHGGAVEVISPRGQGTRIEMAIQRES